MKKWKYDPDHSDSIEDDEESIDPDSSGRGKMPVGSNSKAKAASKTTWRSRQTSKKVSKAGGGIRNRRKKRSV